MGANEHGVVIGNEAVFTRDRRASPTPALHRHGPAAAGAGAGHHRRRGGRGHRRPARGPRPGRVVQPRPPDVHLRQQLPGGRPRRRHRARDRRPAPGPPRRSAGRGRSISNGLTIPAFADAHADPIQGRVAACAARRARTQAAAAAATGPADLIAALRDHGPGGAAPLVARQRRAERPVRPRRRGRHLQPEHGVVGGRPPGRAASCTGPPPPSAPCTSIFKPVRVDQPVDLGPDPPTTTTRPPCGGATSACTGRPCADPQTLLARFTHERDRTEAAWLADPPTTRRRRSPRPTSWRPRWTDDVVGAGQPDRRGRRLRRYWAGQDRGREVRRRRPADERTA